FATSRQVPLPPFVTFSASLASMPFWPLYFLATSLKAGPTILLSMPWQAMQAFLAARAGSAMAGEAATSARVTAASIEDRSFMGGPFGVGLLQLSMFITSALPPRVDVTLIFVS